MKKCPHERIEYCPLYIGMHIVGGPSCWPKNGSDQMEMNRGCAVEQGLSTYEELIVKFWHAHPSMFAEITLAERAHESGKQRARNMRLSGIN